MVHNKHCHREALDLALIAFFNDQAQAFSEFSRVEHSDPRLPNGWRNKLRQNQTIASSGRSDGLHLRDEGNRAKEVRLNKAQS
jgi:hypothetical protein